MVTIPPPLENNSTVKRFVEKFGDALQEVVYFQGETTLVVEKGRILEFCQFARGDDALQFDSLADLTGVDRMPGEPRFEVNYHLLCLSRAERLRLKVRISEKDGKVTSVTSVWPTANWHEREVFDLFGIVFENHPNLRRILCPDEWNGHPLRKDYPMLGYEEAAPSPEPPTKRGWYSTLSD
ncbi:MAG: NADH-quinone oxidoreductase subunit C [Acidobacteriia bacterium]|nr:NADH-quinone oxidoreductase subunit C [Terriglobia bacterium]